jgi:uncharacterized membrane protein
MKRILFAMLLGLGLAAGLEAQIKGPDLGAEVQKVFRHRCGECHAAELRKPKGKFGYVEDLARLRENFVRPGDIEDSDLWLVLSDDFEPMPPRKAENGPMTADEMALVRRWLEAGAPEPRAAEPGETTERPAPRDAGAEEANSTGLADFHPIVVHFPIALILVAALAELLIWFRGTRHEETVRLCLVIGLLAALLAGISGWAAAEAEGYKEATVFAHRWLGVAALGTGLVALVLIETGRRRESRGLLLLGRISILAAAVITALAGHEGGVLVHGPLF